MPTTPTKKHCHKCNTTKTTADFHKNKRQKSGYSTQCKECVKETNKAYREANQEKIKAYKKNWFQENKEHCQSKSQKWAEDNRERRREIVNKSYQANRGAKLDYSKGYREQNQELCARRIKNWEERNPDRVRAKNSRRRAAKLKAQPKWLNEEQKEQIVSFYYLAKDCEVMTGEKYHVDHIVPLQGKEVCGLHVPWNLQVLPSDLNQIKSNKHDPEFYSEGLA